MFSPDSSAEGFCCCGICWFATECNTCQPEVQRDEQNWNDAVAACPSVAWQVALHALPTMLEARVLPSSSSYQATILGSGDNAMEMFIKCRDQMTAAAACGTLAKLLVNDPQVIHANMVAASRTLDAWSPQAEFLSVGVQTSF